ncbi:MAG: alanine racemase [Azospirillaceae bacterium]|nr:alanine racemase [Azospirillaceae bacterium]
MTTPLRTTPPAAEPLTSRGSAVHAGAILTIDLTAIVDNYRLLCHRVAASRCAAVVKADAYGLGAARVAPALAAVGCRDFFVAHIDEALALRAIVPADCAIYVLHGLPAGAEAAAVAANLTPVHNSLTQIEAWTALARRRATILPAVIQVDTGMSRLGLSPSERGVLAADPRRLEGLALRYVLSHLSWAENPDHPANRAALAAFQAARRDLPAAPACFANSSGIFLGPNYHFDLVRPGAALYGIAPVVGATNPMRPVVRLQGRVIQSRTIPAGTPVGYNGRFTSERPCRIATVAVGYADGFLRSLGNRAMAGFAGVTLPIVGAVSMDLITLDVTALDEGRLADGSLIDLIGGSGETVDALAARGGTIGYEILTSLGTRYHRHYRDSPGANPPQPPSEAAA